MALSSSAMTFAAAGAPASTRTAARERGDEQRGAGHSAAHQECEDVDGGSWDGLAVMSFPTRSTAADGDLAEVASSTGPPGSIPRG